MSLTRLLAIARKEILQLRRDPGSLAMGFLMPAILLVLFGYAISWDVSNITVAVLDESRSAASREVLDAFRASGYFAAPRHLERADEIEAVLDRGEAQLVLVFPPDFAARLADPAAPVASVGGTAASSPARLQAIVDGSDANTATIVLAYCQSVVQTFASRLALEGRTFTPPIAAQSRVWYNEELKSRNMIVPGLIAVVMAVIAAMLTSLTIAREWERGTLEQLASTPVTRSEVVLGKLLPYVGIGLVDVAVATAIGVFLFGVPLRGSIVLLGVLSTFFLVGALGLGMFISAAARSQLLASQMAMLSTFLPAYLLSGFMFSIAVMPAPLRAITYLVPARYFLVVTRGIFLKGVGLEVLYAQAALMVLFAAAGLALAVRAFKKELG